MAEQALHYRDHLSDFVDRYAGEYILLQGGDVRWHDERGTLKVSRRELARRNKVQGLWVKFVDPEEAEGEKYCVYEQALGQMKAFSLA